MIKLIQQFLDTSATDPDDRRRSRLLNVLLLSLFFFSFIGLLATFAYDIVESDPSIRTLYVGVLSMMAGIGGIYLINRYGSGSLARVLFVLLITAMAALIDEPQQVAEGRSLLTFAIPITISSVLLHPSASFGLAALSSAIVSFIAFRLGWIPNLFAIITLFVVAFVAWISARSLERSLQEVRTLNAVLDQRVAERTRELAEALNENQAILEGIADGVAVFDNTGQVTMVNPAIVYLLGRPAEEIVGRGVDALLGETVNAENREVIRSLLQSRETRRAGFRFDWGRKTFSASFAPVLNDAGIATGVVAVFHDVTREAELERMKSRFVAMVSHELRTPLNAILGYADMLKETIYGALSEKQLDVVGRIAANAKRQSVLVNDLLDQSQIEAGTLALCVAPFKPIDLVDDAFAGMAVLAQRKGLALTHHIADNVPPLVLADRQRLHQVLANLVNNAIKFTEKGSVELRILRPDAEHWTFEIADTGAGIPAEVRQDIFEPFRRADDSLTRREIGVGLGLSIAKQLVTLMGGEILLESEVGRGSTFTILLPLTPADKE
ncbi:MAG: PAS domain-containing protein [Anaerolineae bacterium]|nr:PAS domain-containing protein [Anaerolineae bacterium]